MSNYDAGLPAPSAPAGSTKTETKTTAATLGAFLWSFAVLTFLANMDSDLLIKALPDFVEVPALSLLGSAITWLMAYNTKHKPGKISPSAVSAVRRSTGTA